MIEKIIISNHPGYVIWRTPDKGYFAFYEEAEFGGRKYQKVFIREAYRVKSIHKEAHGIKFQYKKISDWDRKSGKTIVSMGFPIKDLGLAIKLLSHVYSEITGRQATPEQLEKQIEKTIEADRTEELLKKYKL